MRCVNNADALVFCPVLLQLWAQNDKLGDPVETGISERTTVQGTWYTRCLVYQWYTRCLLELFIVLVCPNTTTPLEVV